jgi:hypothetical protein
VIVTDPVVFAIAAVLILGAIGLLRRDRHFVRRRDDKPTLDVQNHVGDR